MEKNGKTILIVLIALVLGLLAWGSFSFSGNLKAIDAKLADSQKDMNAALNDIKQSRNTLDSMQADLNTFREFQRKIVVDAEVRETEFRSNDKKNLKIKDSLDRRLDSLKAEAGRLKEEFPTIPTKN